MEDAIHELRSSTRKLEDGTARAILRSYGLTFDYLPGEAADPIEPAPAPASAPAAGPAAGSD